MQRRNFFASIGLNSDIKTMWAGGIPLLILVALTVGYMLLQNFTGMAVATLFGLDRLVGLARLSQARKLPILFQ